MLKWKKWISTVLVVCTLISGFQTSLWAAESRGIFFSYTTAQKQAKQLKFYKLNYPKLSERNSICEQQLVNKDKELGTCSALNDGYLKDKADLQKTSDAFQKKYEDTNARLVEVEKDKPSRWTWFAVGSVTTMLVGLVAGFLVRK